MCGPWWDFGAGGCYLRPRKAQLRNDGGRLQVRHHDGGRAHRFLTGGRGGAVLQGVCSKVSAGGAGARPGFGGWDQEVVSWAAP